MGTTEADNVAKVMTVLTNTEINDLSSFVARIARLPEHIARVDYSDLLNSCTKEFCTSLHNGVEVSGSEFTQIHVFATRFSKKAGNFQKFMAEIEKVMNTDEFKLEVEKRVSSKLSEITGYYPGVSQEVIDMEVSSGSSPEDSPVRAPPPPPPPPMSFPPFPSSIPLPRKALRN